MHPQEFLTLWLQTEVGVKVRVGYRLGKVKGQMHK